MFENRNSKFTLNYQIKEAKYYQHNISVRIKLKTLPR